MKCIEEEAICEIRIYYECPNYSTGPERLYEHIEVSQAVKVFKALDIYDILKRLDINRGEIPPGSYLNLFVILLSSVTDSLPEGNWPGILYKHWEF